MNTILLKEKQSPITKMNNFLAWYSKIKNVNPITNEKFDNILERMQNTYQVP